ncbi:MAG: LCP family protein [Candidatus Dojkabacteria bacterium]
MKLNFKSNKKKVLQTAKADATNLNTHPTSNQGVVGARELTHEEKVKALREQRISQAKASGKTISKRKAPKWARYVKSVILIALLAVVFGGIYWGWNKAVNVLNAIGINLSGGEVVKTITQQNPELKKDKSGKFTNALIVGIDTRDNAPGLQNTDTIVIASFNHETKETIMYSIPRDMFVNIPGTPYGERINAIYNTFEKQKKGTGMDGLKKVVESFTGLQIQYYALVDYAGFKKVVDIVGGITVNVDNTFTDYYYPTSSGGYQTVHFDAGPQKMDGETALKYARSRKSQSIEGSDYQRAKRQQKVIKAVKDKVLSSDTLLDPQKILSMLNELQKNIKFSEISLSEIQAGLNLAKDVKDSKVYTFVFDPLIGNGKLIKNDPNSYMILPADGAGVYKSLNKFVTQVQLTPRIYEDDPYIMVYNTGIGNAEASAKTAELQKKYPYITIIYQGTLYTDKTGTYVYGNSKEKDWSGSVNLLGTTLATSHLTKPTFVTTALNGEDIVILLGKAEPKPTTETTNSTEDSTK